MKKSVLLLVLFFYSLSFSQDLETFNKVYSKAYLEIAQTDLQAAMKVADSLYKISETPLLKTRSLMLSATLYKQSGDVKKSIEYALKSGEIIGQTDNFQWQAKVYGFLASQYRILKLHDSSRKYLEKAFQISGKIENPKTDASVIMNAETEKKLLRKLQEFEESTLFTENTISLATLSTYCETNSKYLSYVINTYKKKDFNNYINELRVNYIIEKLKNVPLYRKYKIAVLSEEAGFSSQNKFSTVFKKVTQFLRQFSSLVWKKARRCNFANALKLH